MTAASYSPDRECTASSPGVPAYVMFQRCFFAVCIVLTPIVALVYGLLNPTPAHATSGIAAIAANSAANPAANQLHLALGVLLSFLLPLASLGMAWLALRRAPWLATVAGLLGIVGWIPWSALIGQEALTYTMAQMSDGAPLAALWARYNGSGVMTAYLLVYVIGHLLSAVVLGIAFGRTRLVPIWAAWALALTSPLQIATFVAHQPALLIVSLLVWAAASIPIAQALLRSSDATQAARYLEADIGEQQWVRQRQRRHEEEA